MKSWRRRSMRCRCSEVRAAGAAFVLALGLLLGPAGPAGVFAREAPPAALARAGTTYAMAQSVATLGGGRFAVGRWDGTVSVFRLPAPASPAAPDAPARLEQVLLAPSHAGIELVAAVPGGGLLTSNDGRSLALFRPEADTGELRLRAVVAYDPKHGTANSAAQVQIGRETLLVTGHAEGAILLWRPAPGLAALSLVTSVSVRSPDPIPSPYRLWNVRGVAAVKPGVVVTGSEDGDLSLVTLPEGKVLARTRYSPTAARGINGIALAGDRLAVVSCAVGRADKNTWLFTVGDAGFRPLTAVNLIADPARPQAFAFGVLWTGGAAPQLLASTQEGDVYRAELQGRTLAVRGRLHVAEGVGSALALDSESGLVIAAGRDIALLRLPD